MVYRQMLIERKTGFNFQISQKTAAGICPAADFRFFYEYSGFCLHWFFRKYLFILLKNDSLNSFAGI